MVGSIATVKYTIMIQRIQTLYLFFAALVTLAACFLPVCRLVISDEAWITFNAFSTESVGMAETGNKMVLFGPLAIFAVLRHVWTIFGYNNLKRQVYHVMSSMVFEVVLYVVVAIQYYNLAQEIQGNFAPGIALAMPAVAMILDYLAIRGIKKDIALIRSIDRIR